MKRLLFTALMTLSVLSGVYAEGYDTHLRDSILSCITGAKQCDNYTVSLARLGAKAMPSNLDGDPVPGSRYDCKRYFDRAMTLVSKHGGGRVVVPEGVWFVCGPINLVSNLTLEIQEGATLMFSDRPECYSQVLTSWEGTMLYNFSPFIYGYQLHDVSIVGGGVIDGHAMHTFSTWRSIQLAGRDRSRLLNHQEAPLSERRFTIDDHLRPPMIQFFDCKGITLEGVFITNSPFWCIHLLRSENIICRGLRYDAKLVNNDGIDPEYSRNILIEDIHFDNGDDNVAIKAGRDNDGWAHQDTPSENIIIRRCHFKGLHAVVMGSEMSAGVRNVFVEDCDYAGYCKRGIYIKTNPDRGGYVKNLQVRNCQFDGVEDLFYITTQYAGEGLHSTHPSLITDIYVDGLTCNTVSAAAIVVQGTEAQPVHNVTLRNVEVGKVENAVSIDYSDPVRMENVHLGGHAGVPSTAK